MVLKASVPCGTSCMCIQCRNTPDDVANAKLGWANPVSHQPTSAANLGKVSDNQTYKAGTAVTGVAELAAAASALLASSSSCSSATFDRTTSGSKAVNNHTMSTATPTMMSTSDADNQRFALLLQAPSIMGITSSGGPASCVAMSHASLHCSHDDDGAIFGATNRNGGRPPLPFPAVGNNRRDGTKRLHPDFNFHLQAGGLVVAGDSDDNDNITEDFFSGIDDKHDMGLVQDKDNDTHMKGGQKDFTTRNALVMSIKGSDKRPSMLTRVVNKGGQGASAANSHSHYHHQTTPVGISGIYEEGTMVAALLPLPPHPANAHASHQNYRDVTAAAAATVVSDENDAFAAAGTSATMNHSYPFPGDNTSSSSSSADLLHVVVGIDNRPCFDSGPPNKKTRGAGSSFLRFASPNTISVASALSLLSRAPLASATAADHTDQHHVVQHAADS